MNFLNRNSYKDQYIFLAETTLPKSILYLFTLEIEFNFLLKFLNCTMSQLNKSYLYGDALTVYTAEDCINQID